MAAPKKATPATRPRRIPEFLPAFSFSQQFSKEEILKLESEAKQVTIIRDTWGIPHIYGKTDADAVDNITDLVTVNSQGSSGNDLLYKCFDL